MGERKSNGGGDVVLLNDVHLAISGKGSNTGWGGAPVCLLSPLTTVKCKVSSGPKEAGC